MSWIIRVKQTGEPIIEVFRKPKYELCEKYELVPVLQHLQELNRPGTLAREWMMR